jgi:hypothetical protein
LRAAILARDTPGSPPPATTGTTIPSIGSDLTGRMWYP